MTRTIRADTWSTIVLPFTLTKAKVEAAFGDDVELAEFAGFEVDYGDDEENLTPLGITVNFSTYTMNTKKGMTGGKPFLIKTSHDIEGFEADDVTLCADVEAVAKRDEYHKRHLHGFFREDHGAGGWPLPERQQVLLLCGADSDKGFPWVV